MKNKKVLYGVIGLVLAVALMIGAYALFAPKGAAGAKEIAVTIVNDQNERKVTLHTDEAYLRGALEAEKLIAGDESAYGLYVKTVDGYTVDESKQEWWRFTKGGEMLMTGVDTTPIENGDAFEITMTTGY